MKGNCLIKKSMKSDCFAWLQFQNLLLELYSTAHCMIWIDVQNLLCNKMLYVFTQAWIDTHSMWENNKIYYCFFPHFASFTRVFISTITFKYLNVVYSYDFFSSYFQLISPIVHNIIKRSICAILASCFICKIKAKQRAHHTLTRTWCSV